MTWTTMSVMTTLAPHLIGPPPAVAVTPAHTDRHPVTPATVAPTHGLQVWRLFPALGDQELLHIFPAVGFCVGQRAPPVVVRHVYIGPFLHKVFNDRHMPLFTRIHEGRDPIFILCVNISLIIHKELADLEITRKRGKHEGCGTQHISTVHIHSFGQKFLDLFESTVTGRHVQRRLGYLQTFNLRPRGLILLRFSKTDWRPT